MDLYIAITCGEPANDGIRPETAGFTGGVLPWLLTPIGGAQTLTKNSVERQAVNRQIKHLLIQSKRDTEALHILLAAHQHCQEYATAADQLEEIRDDLVIARAWLWGNIRPFSDQAGIGMSVSTLLRLDKDSGQGKQELVAVDYNFVG